MAMTVARLHKLLGELLEQNRGRMRVCVNKESFQHNLEPDGCVILFVEGAKVIRVPLIDGDGGTAYCQNGTERGSTSLVLDGGN